MTRPARFLFSNGDLSHARRLLIVQSGSHDLLGKVIDLVRSNYAQASLSVLLRRGVGELPADLRSRDGVEYLENVGSKATLLRTLRARSFDGVFVLYSNQSGYWKLKALPFALGVPTVIGVNENLGHFPVNLRESDRLRRHLLWRLANRPTFASVELFEELASSAAAPVRLLYLLAYERLAMLRAPLRGGSASWKRATTRARAAEKAQ
jgi:hypothetical protein